MTSQQWNELKNRVVRWARVNRPTELTYNAPYVWWREALRAGEITDDDFAAAKGRYGGSWTYVGD